MRADANQAAFSDSAVAAKYTGLTALYEGENKALALVRERCAGRPIIDLGVGSGRTTAPLLHISRDYVGIDYAPEMVKQCRDKWRGVRFEVGDARDLNEFPEHHFGLVLFSFNGIDYIEYPDREKVIREASRLLMSDDGLFVFSSHDLRYDRRQTQRWPKRVLGRTKDWLAGTKLKGLPGIYEYRRERLFGSSHTLTTCYVSSEFQERQLRANGFACEAIFNVNGENIAPGTIEPVTGPWLYYVARKLYA